MSTERPPIGKLRINFRREFNEGLFDFFPRAIDLPRLRTIALDIPVHVHLHDLIGSEEPVLNTLLQRVAVDRLADSRVLEMIDLTDGFRRL